MNTIYSYTCYREFIRDFLCEKKKKKTAVILHAVLQKSAEFNQVLLPGFSMVPGE